MVPAAMQKVGMTFRAIAKRLDAMGAVWRRRLAAASGAILVGLAALAFAFCADRAQQSFLWLQKLSPWLGWIAPPLGFVLLVWATRIGAPQARGSGIPQVIVAARSPERAIVDGLVSLRTAAVKFALTIGALAVGGSVGREGPTVQIGGAVMAATHRILRVPFTPGVIIAGGAAGVAAAFNTPLAGVAFAIEELAAAYEQRVTVLVMASVMLAGLVSLGLSGDYLYFGAVHDTLSLNAAMMIAPVAGIAGGLCGGAFSRLVQTVLRKTSRIGAMIAQRPLAWAFGFGLVVAIAGNLSSGATWGTGYEAAKPLVEGEDGGIWFGPLKFASTVATTASGVPGGVFAPSLSVGAGLGDAISYLFPNEPRGAVVLVGMIAYFVGVVRAPLTGVVIVSEMTGARGLILPLFAAAILADGVSALVSRERLYHGLARSVLAPMPESSERPRPKEDVGGA